MAEPGTTQCCIAPSAETPADRSCVCKLRSPLVAKEPHVKEQTISTQNGSLWILPSCRKDLMSQQSNSDLRSGTSRGGLPNQKHFRCSVHLLSPGLEWLFSTTWSQVQFRASKPESWNFLFLTWHRVQLPRWLWCRSVLDQVQLCLCTLSAADLWARLLVLVECFLCVCCRCFVLVWFCSPPPALDHPALFCVLLPKCMLFP